MIIIIIIIIIIIAVLVTMYFHLQCVKWFCAASTVSLVAPVANYAHPPFCFYHSFYIYPTSGKLNQTYFLSVAGVLTS